MQHSFQRELSKYIRKIKDHQTFFFLLSKKKKNIYEMSKDHHQIFLHDNATKTYRKAPPKLEASINLEAKIISSLKLAIDLNAVQEHLLL